MSVIKPHDAEHAVHHILKCKWTMAILAAIADEIQRPSDVMRALPGLSHKVLNQRLAKLVRLQVITRTVVSAKPLHVTYTLSPFGSDIRKILTAVAQVQRDWDGRQFMVNEE